MINSRYLPPGESPCKARQNHWEHREKLPQQQYGWGVEGVQSNTQLTMLDAAQPTYKMYRDMFVVAVYNFLHAITTSLSDMRA